MKTRILLGLAVVGCGGGSTDPDARPLPDVGSAQSCGFTVDYARDGQVDDTYVYRFEGGGELPSSLERDLESNGTVDETTTYEYDAAGRLIRDHMQRCCGSSAERDERWAYDAQGRLTRHAVAEIDDPWVTTFYEYGANGLLWREIIVNSIYPDPGPETLPAESEWDGTSTYTYQGTEIDTVAITWYDGSPRRTDHYTYANGHVVRIHERDPGDRLIGRLDIQRDDRGRALAEIYEANEDGEPLRRVYEAAWTYEPGGHVATYEAHLSNLQSGDELTRYTWDGDRLELIDFDATPDSDFFPDYLLDNKFECGSAREAVITARSAAATSAHGARVVLARPTSRRGGRALSSW